jgi:intracellular sulfur oxidation DsrE/DsrF family protein
MDMNHEAYGLSDHDVTAVIILRHLAMPLGLTDAMWAKYKIGEAFKVTDAATKATAIRNPFLHPDGMSFEGSEIPTMAGRGVVFPVCNMALTHISARVAKNAGVSEEAAKADFQANLVSGTVLVPIGVLAVNRAQERGCTYCYAG